MPSFYERVMPHAAGWVQQSPSRKLAEAEWLLGVWDTAGHVFATTTTEEHDSSVKTERVTKAFNGHALKFASDESDEKATRVAFLTVDPYDGAWVCVEFEPNISYGVQRCVNGWRDGILEFEGPYRIFNDVANWRHRLVAVSGDEWRWENDEQQADGSWLPIDFHWYRRIAGSGL